MPLIVSEPQIRGRPAAAPEGDGGGHFFHEGRSFPSGHAIEKLCPRSVIAHRFAIRRRVVIAVYGTGWLGAHPASRPAKSTSRSTIAGGSGYGVVDRAGMWPKPHRLFGSATDPRCEAIPNNA